MNTIDPTFKDMVYAVKIAHDQWGSNPREDCDGWLGTIHCMSLRNYTLGEERIDSVEEGLSSLAEQHDPEHLLGKHAEYHDMLSSRISYWSGDKLGQTSGLWENFENRQQERKQALVDKLLADNVVLLPLSVYEHSGVVMRTAGLGSIRDSGIDGFISTTYDTVFNQCTPAGLLVSLLPDKAWWQGAQLITDGSLEVETAFFDLVAAFHTRIPNKTLTKAVVKALEDEIRVYNYYLSGDCYGYSVHRCDFGALELEGLLEFFLLDTDKQLAYIIENGEETESCWGFLGDSLETTGIADHISIPGMSDQAVKSLCKAAWKNISY